MVEYLEEFFHRHSGRLFQSVGRTVGFQTAMVATVAFRPVRINTDVFDESASHMISLVYFMVRDDCTTEIRIQKENQGTVKMRMIP